MDADTYPRDDVKKFLGSMVCMKINPETNKAGKNVAQQFGVNSYPRLILFSPKAEIVHVVKGSPAADGFVHEFTFEIWNAFVTAHHAEPRDNKAMAKNLVALTAGFPDTEYGKKAADFIKQLSSWKEFREALADAHVQYERELLAIKAPAQLKLGKKKEAIETWKAILKSYPDSSEAADATRELKKLGVKIEPTEATPKKE